MDNDNPFSLFLRPLNKTGLRYMVTGAAASIIYGEPRLTHDLDLVIELDLADAGPFVRHFPSTEFYCPPVEVIKIEAKRNMRGHFNIIHQKSGFKADVYLMGVDELNSWGMAGRRCYSFGDEPMWLASPEYVIIRKLEYFREGCSEKHLQDIVGILATSHDKIDFEVLDEKTRRYLLEAQWKQAEESYNKLK